MHLHINIIPRNNRDVENPRGEIIKFIKRVSTTIEDKILI